MELSAIRPGSGMSAAHSLPTIGARRSSDASFADFLQTARETASGTVDTLRGHQSDGASNAANQTSELEQRADSALSEFKRTLLQLFHGAGVDTSEEIRLESDGHGGLTVAGGHPDRDRIMEILKNNPDLAQKFDSLQQAFRELESAKQGSSHDDSLFAPVFALKIVDDDIAVIFD